MSNILNIFAIDIFRKKYITLENTLYYIIELQKNVIQGIASSKSSKNSRERTQTKGNHSRKRHTFSRHTMTSQNELYFFSRKEKERCGVREREIQNYMARSGSEWK